MILNFILGIGLVFVILKCFPLFAAFFEAEKPEEKEDRDADGLPFSPHSQICASCKTQNNPQFSKCWKCTGDLPLAILKAQLEVLAREDAKLVSPVYPGPFLKPKPER